MYDAIFVTPWPWWAAGPAIGLVVVLLAGVTGKALGVSTGYGSLCGLGSRLAFFDTREYRESWRLWFVVGLPIGGFAAALLAGGCPSGHSIVGIAQGARSSLVATIGFMLGGLAVFNALHALFGGGR